MYLYSNKFIFHLYKVAAILLVCSFVYTPLFSHISFAEETDPVEQDAVLIDTAEETTPDTEQPEDTPPPEESSSNTTITTGDAEALFENNNILNTNVTEFELASSSTENIDQNLPNTLASSTASTSNTTSETIAASSTEELLHIPFPEQDAHTENTENIATSSTDATLAAKTGSNDAEGPDVIIDSGNAVAYANIVNVVNTNIVNSDGLLNFINDTLGYEDFDLRDTFDDVYTIPVTANSTPSCSSGLCSNVNANLAVHSTNTAHIHNTVTVTADTGGNHATGSTANIDTGNAYAAANVVTVANTNITDSNYLLLVFNNFDDYSGDLILPNNSFFNNQFTNTPANTNIDNTTENNAVVTNTVSITADTGNNNAHTGGDITTGDATAVGTVQNTLNTNLFGGNAFTMLIRVHGQWDGDIFGLPKGMSWTHTSEGIQLVYSGAHSDSTGLHDNLSINTTNTAHIHNDVRVFALTGDNTASGETASIATGDAHAVANVLTLANTNIVGQNWANLIFNIYGNWNGNISFGVPDLWIGATVESADTPIMPSSDLTYTFTVRNNGDTDAPNVTLRNAVHAQQLLLHNADRTFDNESEWNIGTLRAGETREIVINATADTTLPKHEQTTLPLTATVFSDTPDANDDDNTEYIEVVAGKKESNSPRKAKTFAARFNIEKTASHAVAHPGDTVDYSISFFNRAGPLFDAMLIDILEDANGNIIQEQTWPLGTIDSWEDISVDYSVAFSPKTATGTYTNRAQLLGYHESRRKKYQALFESDMVAHELTITNKPAGQILGVSTTCQQYIHEFMRSGANNTPSEVTRLQTFLNSFMDAGLTTHGTFDEATEIAVHNFQQRYADNILTPWGATQSTGYVYLTTRKHINELYCHNTQSFPLSHQENLQIEQYRNDIPNAPAQTIGFTFTEEPITVRHKDSIEAKTEIETEQDNKDHTHTQLDTTMKSTVFDRVRSKLGKWLSTVAEAASTTR